MSSMQLVDHLKELRARLIISLVCLVAGSILSYILYPHFISFFMTPFETYLQVNTEKSLYVSSLFEGFFAKIKLSLLFGLLISFPVHLFNGVRFVFPGLKKKEKWVVGLSILSSTILIAASFYLSYYKIVPFTLTFMTQVGFIPNQVGLLLNFQQNIFYIIHFIFYAALLFQLPIVLEILLAMDVVSRRSLWKQSRFIVLGIFVISALVTPPDFISQLSIGLPLCGLFFLTLLIAKLMKWGEPA